jgi:outer membrane protein OmpA-like peptidoglycan-associated protein
LWIVAIVLVLVLVLVAVAVAAGQLAGGFVLPGRRRSAGRRVAATVASVGLLLGLVADPAAASGDDAVIGRTVRVGSVQVPTAAAFRLRSFNGTSPNDPSSVVGAVHAVNRIEGGTVVYYSMAVEGSAEPDSPTYSYSVFSAANRQLANVTLLVPQSGMAYEVLTAGGRWFASSDEALSWKRDGELLVGYAVFPELPASVTSVQVKIGTQGQVVAGSIPVGQGVLTPTVDSAQVALGSGWPVVPQGSELAGADPAAVTFPLYVRTGTADGSVSSTEGNKQVESTLAADVLFAKDSADLSATAQAALAQVGADLKARGAGQVVVSGYTDSDGTAAYNLDLSRRRAQAVADALTPLAGSAVSFSVMGKGEADPVADNSTPEGQQANRRVTVAYQVVAR